MVNDTDAQSILLDYAFDTRQPDSLLSRLRTLQSNSATVLLPAGLIQSLSKNASSQTFSPEITALVVAKWFKRLTRLLHRVADDEDLSVEGADDQALYDEMDSQLSTRITQTFPDLTCLRV